jgi:hypothetical protein
MIERSGDVFFAKDFSLLRFFSSLKRNEERKQLKTER